MLAVCDKLIPHYRKRSAQRNVTQVVSGIGDEAVDAMERLAQALGCQYLSDLHFIAPGREEAERVLSRMNPPMTAQDYQAVIQYLSYGAEHGDIPQEQLAAVCAELLSKGKK